jgi:hypothetical protein
MQLLAESKGRMELVDNGVSKILEGFDAEMLPISGESQRRVSPGHKLFRFRTLVFGKTRKLEVIPLTGQKKEHYWNYEAVANKYEGLMRDYRTVERLCLNEASLEEASKPIFEIARSESGSSEDGLFDLELLDQEAAATA